MLYNPVSGDFHFTVLPFCFLRESFHNGVLCYVVAFTPGNTESLPEWYDVSLQSSFNVNRYACVLKNRNWRPKPFQQVSKFKPLISLLPCVSGGGGSEIRSEVEPREKKGWKEGVGVLKYFFSSLFDW